MTQPATVKDEDATKMEDNTPAISIVVPAHNEENYLPKCLQAIHASSTASGITTEVIVVLNRCTDRTEAVAIEHGAHIAHEDAKNIARIRNCGIKTSRSEIVVTIDADSYMDKGTIGEIHELLSDPQVVAGGADFRPERKSFPITLSYGVAKLVAKRAGGSMALYWFRKSAFEAIQGFDENRHIGEDIDFSVRLNEYAKENGFSYSMLKRSKVTTSCRKFDEFGDWYALKLFILQNNRVTTMSDGSNLKDMDKYYYEQRGQKPP